MLLSIKLIFELVQDNADIYLWYIFYIKNLTTIVLESANKIGWMITGISISLATRRAGLKKLHKTAKFVSWFLVWFYVCGYIFLIKNTKYMYEVWNFWYFIISSLWPQLKVMLKNGKLQFNKQALLLLQKWKILIMKMMVKDCTASLTSC